jgi:hypothetical protein
VVLEDPLFGGRPAVVELRALCHQLFLEKRKADSDSVENKR